MSWNCPHLVNNDCIRLRKTCLPLQKGCVMEGKVKFIDNQLDGTDKRDLKREAKVSSDYRIRRKPQKSNG